MSHLDEALSAYLDGELTREEEREVTAHLADCHLCRVELTELDEARSAVRSLPILEPPVALDVPAIRPARFRRLTRPAWAAAAVAVLVVGAGAVGMVRGAPQSESVNLDSVAGQHTARVAVDPGVTAVKVITAVSQQ